ncbi:adhesion G-protein coupled receptor G5 [Pseudorasbora parva]|uniref:adhesion G-protein coupled receptor G5 n=1 Tax=Pseudorasbora parva TaxID=51549 RepID=UPI00351F58EF
MTLFLLLIMIYGLGGGECGLEYGNLTIFNDTKTLEMRISLTSGHNITIFDTAKNLSCSSKNNNSTNFCYIECGEQDLFQNENVTVPVTYGICAEENESKTRVDFRIQRLTSLRLTETCEWNPPQCIVVDCLTDKILELLSQKENSMDIPKDLRNILNIKKMCPEVICNENIVDTYIRVEKNAINSVINLTFPEQKKTYYHEDLSMSVVKMNLSRTHDYLQITAPGVFNDANVAETWIPLTPFQNQSDNKIGVVTYDSDHHFKIKLGDKMLISKVIRIEVPGRDIKELINPLKILFKMNYTNSSSNYSLSCQFYDEKGSNAWKTDGCFTNSTNNEYVECSCNHMTPFALLLINLEISKPQWEILSIISYVGCSLSAFFSASSVLSFMFNSNARAEVSSSIHVSLSGSLFLLNISFMLSEWAATLENNNICVFIAVMIHYSLLSSFSWMAVEALHLYLLLIRVFNIYIRHYMIKLSLIGWGVPAVVVGALLSVQNTSPFYGTNKLTFSNTNATNAVCWIREPAILYGVNLSYFTVVFLFNLGILITVSRQIFKLRNVGRSHGKMPAWKDAGTVVGLMCLLGTTWGLAFFTAGYTNYPILYLFCILNTLQGFYIFLWMCGTARKNRAQTLQSKTKSTLDISK